MGKIAAVVLLCYLMFPPLLSGKENHHLQLLVSSYLNGINLQNLSYFEVHTCLDIGRAVHDFMGQHVFTEHVAVSAAPGPGATHPCPYVAYLHPLPPLASSSSSHVPERTMDGPAYHDHWNPLAGPSDGRPLQTVQPTDFHHNHWAHVPHSYAQPNSNNGVTEQPGVPFGTLRAARVDGDSQRRGSVVSPSYFSNG